MSKEEIKDIKKLKRYIFEIFDCENIDLAKNKLNELKKITKDMKNVISRILNEFIKPYFKNLTYAIENRNIAFTSNKIENLFQKVFPKSIKKRMKTKYGVLNRFELKLEYWNDKNKV